MYSKSELMSIYQRKITQGLEYCGSYRWPFSVYETWKIKIGYAYIFAFINFLPEKKSLAK